MNNLPSCDRFSTKLLKDLSRNRKELLEIGSSDRPFTHFIDPLLARDKKLSEMLVECLIHELGLKIKEKEE